MKICQKNITIIEPFEMNATRYQLSWDWKCDRILATCLFVLTLCALWACACTSISFPTLSQYLAFSHNVSVWLKHSMPSMNWIKQILPFFIIFPHKWIYFGFLFTPRQLDQKYLTSSKIRRWNPNFPCNLATKTPKFKWKPINSYY